MKTKKIILVIFLLNATVSLSMAQNLSVLYSTGFETEEERNEWKQYRKNNVYENFVWKFSNVGIGNSYYLYHGWNNTQGWADTIVDWFVSPPLQIIDSTTISLRIQIDGYSEPNEFLQLWFSDGNSNPLTGTFTKIATLDQSKKWEWIDTTLSIPYTSATGFIAFRYRTFGNCWYNVSIDDIAITSPCIVSIGEMKKDKFSEIAIFPNPTNSSVKLFIRDENLLNANLSASICDMFGREIQFIPTIQQSEISVDLSQFASGMYLINFMSHNKLMAIKKLIVE